MPEQSKPVERVEVEEGLFVVSTFTSSPDRAHLRDQAKLIMERVRQLADSEPGPATGEQPAGV